MREYRMDIAESIATRLKLVLIRLLQIKEAYMLPGIKKLGYVGSTVATLSNAGACSPPSTERGLHMLPKLLRFRDLEAVGITNWVTLRRRVEKDGFPSGRLLSPACRVWTLQEVQDWFDSRSTNNKKRRRSDETPNERGPQVAA
jgi:hypothetical protein